MVADGQQYICVVSGCPAAAAGSAPRFIVRPVDVTTTQGSRVLLTCAANGRDRHGQTPRISWLKDGVSLDIA